MSKEKIMIKSIINDSQTSHSLLSGAILNSIPQKAMESIKGNPHKSPEEDERYIEVEFSINGFPTKLTSFFSHIESELGRLIEEKANNIYEEKFSDVEEEFTRLRHNLKESVYERLPLVKKDEWY